MSLINKVKRWQRKTGLTNSMIRRTAKEAVKRYKRRGASPLK